MVWCQCLRYFTLQTRTVDNVQVKDVAGKHFVEHVGITILLVLPFALGLFFLVTAPGTTLRIAGLFILTVPIVYGLLLWWANNRAFSEYREATDITEHSQTPWYFMLLEDPVLQCDAIVLLQHRLVNVQALLDATRTLMISNYKRTCPLYPIAKVDRKTLRAHLSTQLEYDLRTGKMFLDSIEAPALNNSEALCQALLNNDGVSTSASASLMHESKGPTHVISDATEDAAMESDTLNEM